MSMEYCFNCDVGIDTDFNAEHFILNPEGDKIVSCVEHCLTCPNCQEPLNVLEKDVTTKNGKEDKWSCENCSHITVYDWRLSR